MKPRKLKRWHKIFMALVLFISLVLFLAPRIARRYVVRNSERLVGRTLDIEKIRLNYFSGALKIKNLVLYEKDRRSTFVSFGRLTVNLDYWPFFKREMRISELTINELYGQIEQSGELFNFSDLIETSDSTQKEEPEEEAPTGEPYGISINNINLDNCRIIYSDLLLDHTITLQDIDLHIPGFTLRSGSTDLAVDFNFLKGGHLYSALSFHQVDSSYALDFQVDSLNIDIIEPYIKQNLDIEEINGYFTSNIALRGNLRHITEVQLSGWNQVDALHMIDLQGRDILSFNRFKVVIDTLLLDRNQIRLGEISLVDPYILFELIDTSNNWLAMMVPRDSLQHDTLAADTATGTEENRIDFSMAHLSMQDGKIQFYDKTLSQEFASEIHNINIDSRNLATDATEVQINLTADINQTARIRSEFVINPQQMDDLGINLELQHFLMKDLEPYIFHYFGYPVDEGLLSFTTRNDISGKNITSDNNLHVRQFELGKADKTNATYRTPLRLAIGILSDRNGVIDLSIPVRSSDEGITIENLGRMILKTVVNLMVKAATSPVDILSELYNTDPGKLKEFKVGMFERMPGEDGLESLDLVARILDEKPRLRVVFIYAMDQEKYTDSLSYITAVESFREQAEIEAAESKLDPLPDSLLEAFLRDELSGSEVPQNSSLQDLCKQYATPMDLAAKYDSTRLEQTDFIGDYLRENKSIPPDRFSFDHEVPDSLPLGRTHALLHVIFRSLGSDGE